MPTCKPILWELYVMFKSEELRSSFISGKSLPILSQVLPPPHSQFFLPEKHVRLTLEIPFYVP